MRPSSRDAYHPAWMSARILDAGSVVEVVPVAGVAWKRDDGGDRCNRSGMTLHLECEGGHAFRMPEPCDKLDCAHCAPHLASRRGRAAMEGYGGRALGFLILTFPPQVYGNLGLASLRGLRRLAVATWREWVSGLGRRPGVGGCYAIVHPAGDDCLCGASLKRDEDGHGWDGLCRSCGRPAAWEPHVHLGFPLLLRDGSGEPFQVNASRPVEDLERLRLLWALSLRALGSELGFPSEVVIVDEEDEEGRTKRIPHLDWNGEKLGVNVHYSYRVEPDRKAHRLRYDQRPFPAWWAIGPGAWRDALTPRRYGLLSSGASRSDMQSWLRWLSLVVVPRSEDAPDCSCPVCSRPVALVGRGRASIEEAMPPERRSPSWWHWWGDTYSLPDGGQLTWCWHKGRRETILERSL